MFLIHGYLHTMKGAPVADGFIEMQDGHIVSVGPMSELTDVPAGAVDLKGATVRIAILASRRIRLGRWVLIAMRPLILARRTCG